MRTKYCFGYFQIGEHEFLAFVYRYPTGIKHRKMQDSRFNPEGVKWSK